MTFKSAFYRIWNYIKFKRQGVILGKNSDIKYTVYLKKAPNSEIIIGDNFGFYSDCAINPLSRNLRGCISTNEGAKIHIGNNVGMSAVTLRCRNSITIGDRVTIGADALLTDSDGHSLDYRKRGSKQDIPVSKPIVIEEDALIGTKTIILKGVTIGARSVIGSGSIVTKSIPADCIAAGNPCRVIRKIENWDDIHRGG